jgi:hypothetical protein
MKVQIVGYQEMCNCDHCGRNLKHGIKLSDGRTVGSVCLVNKISLPRKNGGKTYRVSSSFAIYLAKMTEHYEEGKLLMLGLHQECRTFDLVEK